MSSPAPSAQKDRGLGTFAGVFTPSVLTILGIILFLRLGYVVGNSGLGRALVILALANTISVLTSISLSAIATNLRVKAGGDYYVISRTLGVAFGGAIGVVLFLSQSISIAFYAIGFGEAVTTLVPDAAPWLPQAIAGVAVATLFVLAWAGADLATKFQFVVMAVLVLAIAAFFVGGLPRFELGRVADGWARDDPAPFWAMFALFFPAVTGFTQGVSLSGDLRDPSRSLPLGTFAAVGVSLVAYAGIAVLFAAAQPLEGLRSDYLALKRLSSLPLLADVGVIAATLSSALASLLGAPRILQAMARDRLFRVITPFARGSGTRDNPRRALLLAFGIAMAGIALGDLNAIAPVISMSLLISYALLNYATFVEARGNSPGFRPRFRFFHAYASLAGTVVCGFFMLSIAPVAGLVALALVSAVYQYLRADAVPGRWADSRRAYGFRTVKETLQRLARQPETEWSHQPHVMAFTEHTGRRDLVVRFASWLSGTSGLTVAVEIVEAAEELRKGRPAPRPASGAPSARCCRTGSCSWWGA